MNYLNESGLSYLIQKIKALITVKSVNGQTGDVVIDTEPEGLDLIDNYNIPTLTEETASAKTDRYLPTTWTESSNTQATNGNFSLEASSISSASYSVSKGFDNDVSTYAKLSGTETTTLITLDSAVKITKLKTHISNDMSDMYDYVHWEIQGSNDNSTWKTLYSSDSAETELQEHILNNADFYKYYRIYSYSVPSMAPHELYIYEFYPSEYYGESSNLLTLSSDIGNYFENQRVLVEIPTGLDSAKKTYININNLGNKQINGELSANKKYELIYNGTSFDVYPIEIEEELNNIKTFVAVYGTTTYAEIQTAVNKGKTVLLDYNGTHRLQLTYKDAQQFNFAGFVDNGNTVFNAVCNSSNEWSLLSNNFPSSNNVVNGFWSGTQAQYDALGSYNATTLYLITE